MSLFISDAWAQAAPAAGPEAMLTSFLPLIIIFALFYFLLSVFAASGFWYIHSWAAIGNPVYPFFPDLFGGSGFKFNIGVNAGMGNNLPAFLKLLWNMTMYPRNFGGEMMGPLFLMFVPLLLPHLKRPKSPRS